MSSTSARSSSSRASRRGGVARELVVRAPRGLQLAPGARAPRRASQLLLAAKASSTASWYDGPREPPLLELAAHREQRLDRRRDVLARRAAAPGVGARAAVGEDPPREHERLLALGPKLGERAERLVVGQVELRLDVRLVGGRAEQRASPRAPSRSPIAFERIVLPAPVSPVIAFSPARARARPRG